MLQVCSRRGDSILWRGFGRLFLLVLLRGVGFGLRVVSRRSFLGGGRLSRQGWHRLGWCRRNVWGVAIRLLCRVRFCSGSSGWVDFRGRLRF